MRNPSGSPCLTQRFTVSRLRKVRSTPRLVRLDLLQRGKVALVNALPCRGVRNSPLNLRLALRLEYPLNLFLEIIHIRVSGSALFVFVFHHAQIKEKAPENNLKEDSVSILAPLVSVL